MFNVLGLSLYCRFFDDRSYFGVEGGQPFLFVVVDIQYLLIFEGLFDVLI